MSERGKEKLVVGARANVYCYDHMLSQEVKHTTECQKNSWEREEKRPKAEKEHRYLTLRQIDIALEKRAEGTESVDKDIFACLEKENPALHGVISNETTVKSPKHGTGKIGGYERVNGFWVFTIRWGRKGTLDGKYSNNDMLKEADKGTAATLEETYASMINYVCVQHNIANIHV